MDGGEKTIKYSVVLSIYNVEKYLKRCLDSIINQTYKNLEIILVDDGSTDSCAQMCDEYAKEDLRVKVIHKLNAGLGEARNSGLHIATGDYICFFDSDDYVDINLFKEISDVIVADNPDLIEFGHYSVGKNGKVLNSFIPNTDSNLYKNEDIMNRFLPELICTDPKTGIASNLLMSAWCCLYKRQLLVDKNFCFVSERKYISEDVYSLMMLMPYVNSVSIIPKAYYYYCENGQSLTHVYRPDRFDKIINFQCQLELLCSKDKYNDEIRYRINRPFLDNLLACMKSEVSCMNEIGFNTIYKSMKRMCSNEIVQRIVRTVPGTSFSKSRRVIHLCIKNKMILCVVAILYIESLLRKMRKRYA